VPFSINMGINACSIFFLSKGSLRVQKLVINDKVLNEDMSMILFGINHLFSMQKIIENLLI
jgi:hypothetical protein